MPLVFLTLQKSLSICSYICENKGNDLFSLWILWDNWVTLISNTNYYYVHCLYSQNSHHWPNNGQNDSYVHSHLQQKTLHSLILQYNEEKLQVGRQQQLPRENLRMEWKEQSWWCPYKCATGLMGEKACFLVNFLY